MLILQHLCHVGGRRIARVIAAAIPTELHTVLQKQAADAFGFLDAFDAEADELFPCTNGPQPSEMDLVGVMRRL